jgi:beta-aspartyl-peptidase (threonine type)
MSSTPYVIAVHGGAGTIAPEQTDTAPYHAGLRAALEAGAAVLARGGSALDAAQAAVQSLEDCPLFNAGRGAVYTADARHEMDASVMEGATLQAGAVAGIHGVRNPVGLARAVMEHTSHVLLVGEGAMRFAHEQQVPMEDAAYFHSEQRLAQLERVRAMGAGTTALDHSAQSLAEKPAPIREDGKHGTVGAVALDQHGNVAAAVSTGGLTNKRAGRVGDSPVVGAGIYANNASCAIACTGTGEHFLRACVGHDVHARMVYCGESLDTAANAVVHGELSRLGGQGGLVSLNAKGEVSMPFNSLGMYRGVMRQGQPPETAIFRNEAAPSAA